jgi:hypothetical protein
VNLDLVSHVPASSAMGSRWYLHLILLPVCRPRFVRLGHLRDNGRQAGCEDRCESRESSSASHSLILPFRPFHHGVQGGGGAEQQEKIEGERYLKGGSIMERT